MSASRDKTQFVHEIARRIVAEDGLAIYHVIPTDDVLEHREGMDCPCRPELQRVQPRGAVIVHNSWDGREAFEDLA